MSLSSRQKIDEDIELAAAEAIRREDKASVTITLACLWSPYAESSAGIVKPP